TDARGEFSFPSPNAPPFLSTVIARTPGKVATVYASAERPAELALKKAARLELTFADAEGNPLAGVTPWVTGQDGANRQRPPSDLKGHWAMDDLVDGPLEVRVNAPWVLTSASKLEVRGPTRATLTLARGV